MMRIVLIFAAASCAASLLRFKEAVSPALLDSQGYHSNSFAEEFDLEDYLNRPGEADIRCRSYKSHFIAGLNEASANNSEWLQLSASGSEAVGAAAGSISEEARLATNSSEVQALGEELRMVCMGPDWNGNRCQDVVGAIRQATWARLRLVTIGVTSFDHLQEHGMAPAVKTFRTGGGVSAEIPCRGGHDPAQLFYRHTYRGAGMAIKKNLAILAHDNPKKYLDKNWHSNNLCESFVKGTQGRSVKPVLFTFVRDPLKRFISGYAELAARGLIDSIRGQAVGTQAHAELFLDNVFHGTCDNGQVLLQVQGMMGSACESRFDFVGKVETLKDDWHELGNAASCTDTLYWPRNWKRSPDVKDHGAKEAMKQALKANQGKLKLALCVWLLPDYIAFDYPLPKGCAGHNDLMPAD